MELTRAYLKNISIFLGIFLLQIVVGNMAQTHLSFQRGQEAWLAEFEKWWGRNNEAALVARPTLRVQSNAEIARAHGQRIMCDL